MQGGSGREPGLKSDSSDLMNPSSVSGGHSRQISCTLVGLSEREELGALKSGRIMIIQQMRVGRDEASGAGPRCRRGGGRGLLHVAIGWLGRL